jgi:hypothetical protein
MSQRQNLEVIKTMNPEWEFGGRPEDVDEAHAILALVQVKV